MSERYDAIIIGAGHNGLTCGAYLARAGLKTLVLERREVIGGAAVTEEVVPGFKFSVFSYLMSLLHPKVIHDLELSKYGYEVLPASDMFAPLPGNDYIVFSDDVAKTQASFARFSQKDAAIYPEFDRYLMESVQIMRKILLETPPDPSCRDWRSFKESAKFLWKYRKVGGKLFRLIDLMTMSADDYLSEWFESTEVKAVLAYYSGIGTFAGPRPGFRLCRDASRHGRARWCWRLGLHPRRHGHDHAGDRSIRSGKRARHQDQCRCRVDR